MVVSGAEARAILSGRKTRTTRPAGAALKAKPGHLMPVQVDAMRHDWGRNVRTRDTRCRVIVLRVRDGLLHQVTEDDARAEGYEQRPGRSPRSLMLADWRERYGEGCEVALGDGSVVVVEIAVQVVEYVLDRRDRPMFLAAGGGYTESPTRSADVDVQPDLNGRLRNVPLEAVRDERYLRQWARRADEERLRRVADAKARWRDRRRFGEDGA